MVLSFAWTNSYKIVVYGVLFSLNFYLFPTHVYILPMVSFFNSHDVMISPKSSIVVYFYQLSGALQHLKAGRNTFLSRFQHIKYYINKEKEALIQLITQVN